MVALSFLGSTWLCFQAALSPPSITYHIHPIPASDRSLLEVKCAFKAAGTDPIQIGLPADGFGLGDLSSSVVGLAGLDGTKVESGQTASDRTVIPGPTGEVSIRYELSFDPDRIQGASYGPIARTDQIQVFACQIALRVGTATAKKSIHFQFDRLPKGWIAYSSLSPDPNRYDIVGDDISLRQAVVGAGAGFHRRFEVKGKPIDVFVGRGFAKNPSEWLSLTERIVRFQRDWFKDYSQPFFVISVQPRPDNVAGIRLDNCFACFVRPDVRREELMLLLAHEMCHNWIPGQIQVDAPDSDLWWRWAWFTEGFDDYFSRRLLFDQGLLSKERFAYLINRDVRNVADNPHRNIDDQGSRSASENGSFNTSYVKLFYYRGALMASNWDSQARRFTGGKRNFDDFLREIYREAKEHDGHLASGKFYEIASRYGISAEKDRESFVLKGLTILPDPSALEPDYQLVETPVPTFDPGFDIPSSLRAHKVVSIERGSAAEKAGLREGMKLLDIENSNRFSNAFRLDAPIRVSVEADGRRRQISFVPYGPPMALPQYRKLPRRPTA